MQIAAEKLIVALDDLSLEQALNSVNLIRPYAKTFKVGLSLFCAYGPLIVQEIRKLDVEVFLDLKLFDISMQVKKTLENILYLGPRYITVHGMGGKKMLMLAADILRGSNSKLLAVSVLTSFDQKDLLEIGFTSSMKETVLRLTDLAYSSGVDGFVSSPHEALAIKNHFENCMVICPGVRFFDQGKNDQKRIMGPKEAIMNKADALVVGRPITKAVDKAKAAKEVNLAILKALQSL